MSRDRQRGGGKLATLLVLLVVAAMAYTAIRIIPPYVTNYELEDFMKTEARFAAVNRKSPEAVRQAVFQKMQELEIPATIENVRVENRLNTVIITVTYSVDVDFLGLFTVTFDFESTADNRMV